MFFIKYMMLFGTQLSTTVYAAPYEWNPSPKFDCSKLVPGLRSTDCEYMSKIGIAGQGLNSQKPNHLIWIGKQGPNIFNFENKSGVDMILIVWHYPIGDYAKLFISAWAPKISYSLSPGQKVTISIADDVSGGWGGIYDRKTKLANGLLQNTWGEFTTDPTYVKDDKRADVLENGKKILNTKGRTHVDVSKLVYMKGNKMSTRMGQTAAGCVSSFEKCYFECVSDVLTCGRQNEYRLVNCDTKSQPGANYGLRWGQPEGGCSGLERNGYVSVTL